MSAKMPATTAMGALPKTPLSRRKTRKDGQVGASPQAMVQTMKARIEPTMMWRRPYCSLRGAQKRGPAPASQPSIRLSSLGKDRPRTSMRGTHRKCNLDNRNQGYYEVLRRNKGGEGGEGGEEPDR